MKMEAKDKVQPDVIHQIIVNIKAATMEAIKANRDLKTLEQHHEQVTHEFAALQDKVYAARARRAERTRLLIARVEAKKPNFLAMYRETPVLKQKRFIVKLRRAFMKCRVLSKIVSPPE